MDSELLSLKWNNHKNTFLGIIKLLRNKASYSDATLACEGKFYQVHKIVLSVCSDYFSEIFENTPCKNPVIVLKDISSRTLEFLLDYMYLGEVNVKQTELSVLIKAAECLQVKGLAAPDDEQDTCSEKKQSKLSSDNDEPPPKRRKKRHSQILPQELSSEADPPINVEDPIYVDVKPEPVDNPETVEKIEENNEPDLKEKCEESFSIDKEELDYGSYSYDPSSSGVGNEPEETWKDYNFDDDPISTNLETNPDDPNMLQSFARRNTPGWREKKTLNRNRHVCKFCTYSSFHSPDVKKHMRRHTGEKPFSCSICKFRTAYQSALSRHIRIHTKNASKI